MAFTRLTKIDTSNITGVKDQLSKVAGEGEQLLSSAASQASNAINQAKSAFNKSNISVITADIDSVTKKFTSALDFDIPEIGDLGVTLNSPVVIPITGGYTAAPTAVLGPTENQLKGFASYNYIITLACLTTNELNFPDSTYRIGPPQVTVLKSGGGAPGKAKTAYETSDAQLEYFIDEIELNALIAPTSATRTSNATTMSFKVQEPYSMGLFLQTLMIAANNAGHADYLKAPYALIIEFKGWDDNGNPLTAPNTRRVFPIKINKVDFDVNSGGSTYSVNCHAWNESALSNVAQHTRTDTIITGNNVLELLQAGPESLTGIMNRRIREKAQDANTITKDEYVIMFPHQLVSSLGIGNQAGTTGEQKAAMTEREFYRSVVGIDPEEAFDFELEAAAESYENYINLQASNNNLSAIVKRLAESEEATNSIGTATIAQSIVEGGNVPFGREAFVRDPDTDIYRNDRVQISNNFRTFQFPQGATIEQIIEEIVVLSVYGRDAATKMETDSDGMIDWFRIHTQTFLVPDAGVRERTGENPKIFVYAVVPYKVHSSVFSNASQASVGIDERIEQAAKTYDYIYTGKNDDIIDFEINFNNAFFKALSSNPNGSGDAKLSTKEGTNNPNNSEYNPAPGQQGNNSISGSPVVNEVADAHNTGKAGGGANDTPEVQVARQFNEAIVNSNVDLVTMDLTVLGDPYYLADTGQGNYSSPAVAKAYTADGTMDYQRSEVEVVVNFRTPIDYNTNTGGMIFPENTVPVKAFSGLYKVNTVTNNFSGGKFTQVLHLIRRPNQDSDIGTGGTSNQSNAMQSGEAIAADATTNTNVVAAGDAATTAAGSDAAVPVTAQQQAAAAGVQTSQLDPAAAAALSNQQTSTNTNIDPNLASGIS